MITTTSRKRALRFAAAGALALGALSLTACDASGVDIDLDPTASTEPTESVDPTDGVDETEATDDADDSGESAYDGPYDSGVLDEIDSYVGKRVTMTGTVDQTFTDFAFTVVSADGDIDPLLIVDRSGEDGPAVASTVEVTGVVGAFDAGQLGDDWGIELDEDVFGDWEGLYYIDAERVEAE
ncbi:hypothetical protein [Agromyces sp. SYSU T0242]|uniref:hypothetical protein n=1 Tax=Agromyces litoreus TaxID=3158561 RepID=UPI003394130B